jgi:hypothetical protein
VIVPSGFFVGISWKFGEFCRSGGGKGSYAVKNRKNPKNNKKRVDISGFL